jgi:hypothetical protein
MKQRNDVETGPGMRSRRRVIGSAIGLAVLLGAAALITALALSGPGSIKVSSTAVRPGAAGSLTRLRNPPPLIETPPIDPFSGRKVTDDPSKRRLSITVLHLPDLKFEPAFKVFEATKVDDWIVTPAGRVRLVAVGVANPAAVPPGRDRVVPVTYYHPADLTKLPVTQLPQRQRREKVYIQDDQVEPIFRFVFECDGFDHPQAIGYDIYDGATEVPLPRGYRANMLGDSAYVQFDLPVWHGPAVELAMDLAHGPMTEHEIPAESGARWRHGPLHVEVLQRLDKRPGVGHSSSRDEDQLHVAILYRENEPDEKPFNGLLVGILPRRNMGVLDLDLINPHGEVITDRAYAGTGDLRYIGNEVAAEDIVALRARWRPNFKRFIWRIPALPAVGSGNRGVTDLTQIHLSRVTFDRAWQMGYFIAGLLQINLDFSSFDSEFEPPPGYFPVTFEDVTAGTILNEYLRHVAIPSGHRAIFDEDTMTLKIAPTWFTRLRFWLDVRFGHWF